MLMLILTLALIGFVVYLITNYIPMPPIFKTGILVIVAVFVIIYLMGILGIADLPVPRMR